MIIREIDIRLPSRLDELEPLFEALDFFVRTNAIPQTPAYRLQLAVDEFVANAVAHGYEDGRQGEIGVKVRLDGDMLELTFSDDGAPFDPFHAPPPDLTGSIEERRVGGLGIHLVRTLAVSVAYRYEHGSNIVVIRLHLTEPTG
ncbi:ATP-binding protein [Ancylobacter amanitiformis]|uniref:Anti-sigma regulatory factor (Ser/Thr protein kinase) n=1 Tax=Ancylobacter amanitiformis TaxID=217069 RepID=A0ABU0LKQ4_9HYPH|nr:ATP-binding protein [Ancylobacter amanitiformis]MDQ0509234.1 anti-sigma regulatory factor (Ser/Thr protein kinase) [Ancylobacter amanitiformis]